MVVLATVATVIASQSIISVAYSLTEQTMQLGFLPRMRVQHRPATRRVRSTHTCRQLALLAAGTLGAVITFGSSGALGGCDSVV